MSFFIKLGTNFIGLDSLKTPKGAILGPLGHMQLDRGNQNENADKLA